MARSLRLARRSAVRGRTQVTNQMRALILTTPADIPQHTCADSLARTWSKSLPGSDPGLHLSSAVGPRQSPLEY